jgi:hypothetical protein
VALGHNLLGGRIDPTAWEQRVEPAVAELGKAMEQASICGLGRSVPVPLKTTASFFRPDLDHYLQGGAAAGAAAVGANGGELIDLENGDGGAEMPGMPGMPPPRPAGAVPHVAQSSESGGATEAQS